MSKVTDREKALEAALAQIDKQFGKGSVMRLGDQTQAPVEVIPTGSVAMDVALGIGGLPRGRVVEIYGPESSGKTTLALHAVANAQRVIPWEWTGCRIMSIACSWTFPEGRRAAGLIPPGHSS